MHTEPIYPKSQILKPSLFLLTGKRKPMKPKTTMEIMNQGNTMYTFTFINEKDEVKMTMATYRINSTTVPRRRDVKPSSVRPPLQNANDICVSVLQNADVKHHWSKCFFLKWVSNNLFDFGKMEWQNLTKPSMYFTSNAFYTLDIRGLQGSIVSTARGL